MGAGTITVGAGLNAMISADISDDFTCSRAGTLTFSGDLGAGAKVIRASGGQFNFAANDSFNTIDNSGTVDLGGNTATISHFLGQTGSTIQNGTFKVSLLTQLAGATVDNDFSGAGGVRKHGGRTATINGNLSHTGATEIETGTLLISSSNACNGTSGMSWTGNGTFENQGCTTADAVVSNDQLLNSGTFTETTQVVLVSL